MYLTYGHTHNRYRYTWYVETYLVLVNGYTHSTSRYTHTKYLGIHTPNHLNERLPSKYRNKVTLDVTA